MKAWVIKLKNGTYYTAVGDGSVLPPELGSLSDAKMFSSEEDAKNACCFDLGESIVEVEISEVTNGNRCGLLSDTDQLQ